MDILLYAIPDSKAGQQLESMLKEITPPLNVVRYQLLQHFIQRIKESRVEFQIVISVIERPKEFLALHSFFEDNQTTNLIIICDDKEEIVALAHELRPRFLAHGNELQKVIAVVEKMMQSPQRMKC